MAYHRCGAWRAGMLGLFMAAFACLPAGAVEMAVPEDVGISSERLGRIGAMLEQVIAEGRIPGAVVLVARNGKVAYFEAFGHQDRAAQIPMRKDSIFRIYSMSKPIVSVAAMTLVEEGKLLLSDPIFKYLPEFADATVGTVVRDDKGEETVETAAAQRAITVQDLLRHTAGLTYGVFGKSAIKSMYLAAGVHKNDQSIDAMVRKLAAIPLVREPGTFWEYSRATDVLGRLLEVVDGKPLDAVVAERVLQPLAMRKTGFHVADPAAHNRIAQPQAGADGNVPNLIEVTGKPAMLSGGGGMVSTAEDYARFCQMLLNGGSLDGARVLSPTTVRYMTADHLGEIGHGGPGYLPGPGHGFGLGFAVRLEDGVSSWPGSKGDYFWGGYAGTYFWVDPEKELFAVYMMQAPQERLPMRLTLRSLVYQALLD